jgi:hypothetical protein
VTTASPLDLIFDPTPEIFATDAGGGFFYPLVVRGKGRYDTSIYDEVRVVVSIWHPSGQKSIDLDRAYLELRGSFDPDEDHWARLAEIEPVVAPPHGGARVGGGVVFAQQRAVPPVGGSGGGVGGTTGSISASRAQ